MKKLGLISFISLLAIGVASCSFIKPPEKVFEKTELEYCYEDYANNSAYGISSCPTHGDVNILVVPIWFTDSNTYILHETNKNNVLQDIDASFNAKKGELGWHSVSSYFEEESKGILKLNAVVSEWYNAGTNLDYYSRGYNKTAVLVDEVTTWFFANHSYERTYFDADRNGYLDAVVLIYGGPDYQVLNSKNKSNLWAYTSWLTAEAHYPNIGSPEPNVFMWASYDFMYGQSVVYERAGTDYRHGDTRYTSIDTHTFIHEMGHVLGLEDYYDYSDLQYTPAGGFSMQDYNVGGHDPYALMAYGWANPIIPTVSATVTISDFQSSHDVILLANHEVNSPFDEYMLLELYTPTGLNQFDSAHQYYNAYPLGSSSSMIRLWHVDARLLYVRNSSRISDEDLTTNPSTKLGYVLHAFSNTYDKDRGSILSRIDTDYINYNILQLIRNDTKATYEPTDVLTSAVMFGAGDTYDQKTFSRQFVKKDVMNDGKALGWKFVVNEVSSTSANISLYKI